MAAGAGGGGAGGGGHGGERDRGGVCGRGQRRRRSCGGGRGGDEEDNGEYETPTTSRPGSVAGQQQLEPLKLGAPLWTIAQIEGAAAMDSLYRSTSFHSAECLLDMDTGEEMDIETYRQQQQQKEVDELQRARDLGQEYR
ncbi:Hypothetical predicted protein [Drosophila guanche]|uniref:Uncharacterized protein n=1 Tax=Drosophila guanche TaxID=7266 RepID=A0A3B0KYQ3_DROGU|nr:Hypothetical predicted protein [Drosophila guanche]